MNSISEIKRLDRYHILLYLSILLFLLKGLEYAFLGIPYPLIVALILLSPFLVMLSKREKLLLRVLKYWSILVISYGLYRAVLQVFVHAHGSGVPSAAYYQFTVWYGIKTLLFVLIGWYLFLKRKHFNPNKTEVNPIERNLKRQKRGPQQ